MKSFKKSNRNSISPEREFYGRTEDTLRSGNYVSLNIIRNSRCSRQFDQ